MLRWHCYQKVVSPKIQTLNPSGSQQVPEKTLWPVHRRCFRSTRSGQSMPPLWHLQLRHTSPYKLWRNIPPGESIPGLEVRSYLERGQRCLSSLQIVSSFSRLCRNRDHRARRRAGSQPYRTHLSSPTAVSRLLRWPLCSRLLRLQTKPLQQAPPLGNYTEPALCPMLGTQGTPLPRKMDNQSVETQSETHL